MITLANLGAQKIQALRAFAAANNITVVGDKRRKATYILAIEMFLLDNAVAEGTVEFFPATVVATITAQLAGHSFCAVTFSN